MKSNLFGLSRKEWKRIIDNTEDFIITAFWSFVFFGLLYYATLKAWVL